MALTKFARFFYQPVLPLGKNRRFVTSSAEHWKLARDCAAEGTVLLKNDGTLPLKKKSRVVMFGIGAGEFLYGGGGSAEVFSDRYVSTHDALQARADSGEIEYFAETAEFYRKSIAVEQEKSFRAQSRSYVVWRRGYHTTLPTLPEELYQRARHFGGVALFCVSRFSSEGDDTGDRTGKKGDFYLWDEEAALLERLYQDFSRVVVVLNTCGPVSTSEYDRASAVLYPLYGGALGGEAIADILLGKAYPSGRLQHTLAKNICDYPGTDTLYEGEDFVCYREDIFVGYRYFETFCPEKVVYPFGFGLSYTEFSHEILEAKKTGDRIRIRARVKNTGSCLGKDVIQAYLSAPQGKLGKAKRVLCAFEKTKELAPNEEQLLSLSFLLSDFASFDDTGKILEGAFLLEAGEYSVSVGKNVREAETCLRFSLKKDVVSGVKKPYLAPSSLPERLCADGTMEKLPPKRSLSLPIHREEFLAEKPQTDFSLAKAIEEDRIEEFLSSLSDEEMACLLHGHPMTNVSLTCAIGMPPKSTTKDKKLLPLIPTTDGPNGVRARPGRGITTTFFPCESTVGQSWNPAMAEKVGKAMAREAKENNMGVLLAPGLNIHRTPLCGRNFEYYSEDPLCSGRLAAACVRGIQSQRISATIKHFCCNNRENNRRFADARVSQRALREIYLKGFEIAIREGDPWALMTSYNPVNGTPANANREAIQGILREEWGYQGLVMTDWWVLSLLEDEVHAGSDVKMPESTSTNYQFGPEICDPYRLMQEGVLDRGAVIASVRRILNFMAKFE